MIIGLTGGMGSGKTIAASFFVEKGFALIDADEECRRVTENDGPALADLTEAFGPDILDTSGKLNRTYAAALVFSDKDKLNLFGRIVRDEALKSILSKMEEYKVSGRNVIFDVPLLFECGWDRYCDITITVSAYIEQRIMRIIKRDGLSVESAMARINNQMKDAEREKLSDYVIFNNGETEELRQNVFDILAKYNI